MGLKTYLLFNIKWNNTEVDNGRIIVSKKFKICFGMNPDDEFSNSVDYYHY